MRCQKSKRACPGYRDSSELSLRNETKATKKKPARPPNTHSATLSWNGNGAQHGSNVGEYYTMPYTDTETSSPPWSSAMYPSPASSTSSLSIPSSLCSRHMALAMRHNLSTPVDEQVFCYFLSNYVLIPAEGISPRGFFDFVIPLLQKEHTGSPMSVAFSAVALAAFSGRPSSKSLLPRADAVYVKALNQINLVLQDPKLALKDSTLATVLLLAFYEVRSVLSRSLHRSSLTCI